MEYAPILGSSCTLRECLYVSYLCVLTYILLGGLVIHMTLHVCSVCTVGSGFTPHRVCIRLAFLGT